MPPIINDPTLSTCPDFESPLWDLVKQAMIATHVGPEPLTEEGAVQQMKNNWTRGNEIKIAAWNAQLEQERAERAEQERVANEAEEAQRAQQEREAAEEQRAIERKKPKLNAFDPNRSVPNWIEPRPSPYALNKIELRQYVELDHFTVRGCREAALGSNRSINQDSFGFTQVDDAFVLRPLAAQASSKNVRNDEDLSWEEMLEAKNTMLHFMDKYEWPRLHVDSTACFFLALEVHPRRLQIDGKKALLRYQSIVRQEWFGALSRGVGYNLEIINEDLLRTCADFVNERVRKAEMEEVRAFVTPHQNSH